MWHVEKKLLSLYRSSSESIEPQVDMWTSQISGILYREQLITGKPDFPFSFEKLEYFYETLKSKLQFFVIRKELYSILREKPEQYEYFLDGKQLEQNVISKISGYIEKYGDIARVQYSSFYGIRKNKKMHYMIHDFEHVNEFHKKTFKNLSRYEKLYTIIKENTQVYQKILDIKKKRKREQERVRKQTAKSDDSDDDIAGLQRSIETLDTD